MTKQLRRVPNRGRRVSREGDTRHVQTRLDKRIPREAEAIRIYDYWLDAGYAQRDIVIEGLLRLNPNETQIAPSSQTEVVTRGMMVNIVKLLNIAHHLTDLMVRFRSGALTAEEYSEAVQSADLQFRQSANEMFAEWDSFED
jgi:hypothetical protein